MTANEMASWRKVKRGLAFVRRGSVLACAAGLLILGLGSVARAGCASPHLPEIVGLLHYQSLIFHLAFLLGFVVMIGGQAYALLMPRPWRERLLPLACSLLAGVALILIVAQADPGQGAAVTDTLPRLPLWPVLLGTAALAGSVLVVITIARAFGGGHLIRESLYFAGLVVLALFANAEAAAGFIAGTPVRMLWSVIVAAAVDAVALSWLLRLLRGAEDLIQSQLTT